MNTNAPHTRDLPETAFFKEKKTADSDSKENPSCPCQKRAFDIK
jgi:hypothetical protein